VFELLVAVTVQRGTSLRDLSFQSLVLLDDLQLVIVEQLAP
jgi:hypothetical protein